MVNQELLDYIKQQRAQGAADDKIKSALLTSGWLEPDIDAAFVSLANPLAPSVQPAATALPDAGELLRQAWEIYKKRWQVLLGIGIIPAAVGAVYTALVASPGYLKSAGLPALFAIGAIAFIALILAQLWSQAALILVIKDHEKEISIPAAFQSASSLIASYLWISFLSGLIVLGGFILLIVPGIIFAIWYSLSTYILVAEGLKGVEALKKSKEYVAGFWGGVFWRFLLIGLAYLVLVLAVSMFFLFLHNELISVFKQFLVSFLFTPFMVAYGYLIYEKLKQIKGTVKS